MVDGLIGIGGEIEGAMEDRSGMSLVDKIDGLAGSGNVDGTGGREAAEGDSVGAGGQEGRDFGKELGPLGVGVAKAASAGTDHGHYLEACVLAHELDGSLGGSEAAQGQRGVELDTRGTAGLGGEGVGEGAAADLKGYGAGH